jgi:hypothetical protein
VVEHQRVVVRVGEERHVADARIEGRALEADAALLERRARCGDVVDMQSDHSAADVVGESHRRRVHHAQCEVGGLELGEVAIWAVHRARQTERRAVELDRRREVVRRYRHEVDAADDWRGCAHGGAPFVGGR